MASHKADFVFQHNPKFGNEVKFLDEPFTLPTDDMFSLCHKS